MKVVGSYQEDGYAHLQGLIPPEVTMAFLHILKQDMGSGPILLSRATTHPNLLMRPAFDVYGYQYKTMLGFLWGLTPIVSQVVGRELLPTYDYLRIYRAGDVCHVHSDRYSCEHSLSLTLGYSDGKPWDLELERQRSEPSSRVEPGFGDSIYQGIATMPGDAVLYQGIHHRHGRTTPNPNRWSAHLFLHWVDRDGPHRDHAFDRKIEAAAVDFSFG
jgi:hypothetical protein